MGYTFLKIWFRRQRIKSHNMIDHSGETRLLRRCMIIHSIYVRETQTCVYTTKLYYCEYLMYQSGPSVNTTIYYLYFGSTPGYFSTTCRHGEACPGSCSQSWRMDISRSCVWADNFTYGLKQGDTVVLISEITSAATAAGAADPKTAPLPLEASLHVRPFVWILSLAGLLTITSFDRYWDHSRRRKCHPTKASRQASS